jgi:hypothetical protein
MILVTPPHPQIVMTKDLMIEILSTETELIGEIGKYQVAVSHTLGILAFAVLSQLAFRGHCDVVLSSDL